MRKNLSGKTEWAKHTRNTAMGKRGVNKLERQAPLPDQDEPSYKHRRRKTKSPPRPWLIEVDYGLFGRGWELFSSYETKEQRDQALEKHLRKGLNIKFRAVDPIGATTVETLSDNEGAGTDELARTDGSSSCPFPADELGDIVRKPPSERA